MTIRLDKLLTDMSVGSRSRVRELIKKGLVSVDGQVVRRPEAKVDASARVLCAGSLIPYTQMEYYLLHKPAGYVTAVSDPVQKTVMSLLPAIRRSNLSPVGRLDKDTEGLLLITNDGGLSHRLLAPGKHVAKVYEVHTDKPIPPELVSVFAESVDIGDETPTAPAKLELREDKLAFLTLTEGRYHQIKRMFAAFDLQVVYLKRLAMGSLWLDEDLPAGSCRTLSEQELAALAISLPERQN